VGGARVLCITRSTAAGPAALETLPLESTGAQPNGRPSTTHEPPVRGERRCERLRGRPRPMQPGAPLVPVADATPLRYEEPLAAAVPDAGCSRYTSSSLSRAWRQRRRRTGRRPARCVRPGARYQNSSRRTGRLGRDRQAGRARATWKESLWAYGHATGELWSGEAISGQEFGQKLPCGRRRDRIG
jgi:hypothetical protein